MTERDIELHRQAGWSDSKLIELVRADAMEAATRAANESWTLLAKSLVLAEREACKAACQAIGEHYALVSNSRAEGAVEECVIAIEARSQS